jgi:2-dehydro-3-deoxygalactonokinase
MNANDIELIAVDWGTTNCRAYAISAAGKILAESSSALGILAVPPDGFPSTLREQLAPWLDLKNPVPVVVCGMAGSRQGWREAPYAQCPASLEDVAKNVILIQAEYSPQILLVPGLSYIGTDGNPDVMRGEETQLFGAGTGLGTGIFCLPGTHSKWAILADGSVQSFETYMTGELFDVLSKHSILARTVVEGLFNPDAFGIGVGESKSGSLLHQIFAVRTRSLFGMLSSESARSYLSGLVVGHEITAALAKAPAEGEIVVVGSPSLTSLYATALKHRGRSYRVVDAASAVTRGAFRLYRSWCSNSERPRVGP